MMLACKKCMMLTEQESCPSCGGEVSKEWQGMIVIVDHTQSEVARHMGIKGNGKYALKVR
ncbi:MAG: DNA-directed RNA polymerase subunit E [Candidatus Thermoplasmatota archaeon]|nr:DNA-directed RNA polymerase subunit E [Candidatus Thermoplasmatota archaeon]